MIRRQFLGVVGGAAVWPLAASAQHGERLRRVDVLLAELTEGDPYYEDRLAALTEGLLGLGWIASKNLKLVIHRVTPRPADIRKHVTDLLAERPDVVVSGGGTTTGPWLQATTSVPVVFASAVDPVGAGHVESLAHPGGNATGFMQFDYSAISIAPPGSARAVHAGGGSGATETAANCNSSSCRNAGAGPKTPVRACRRQTVSKFGCTRATSMTLAPCARLSSTTRRFSAIVHRRRRSGPDRTVTLLTFAHLLANQSANYRSHACRPEGGPHRRITSVLGGIVGKVLCGEHANFLEATDAPGVGGCEHPRQSG